VIVEGVNIHKRHSKPTQKLPQGASWRRKPRCTASRVMLVWPEVQQGRAGRAWLPGRRDEGARVQAVRGTPRTMKRRSAPRRRSPPTAPHQGARRQSAKAKRGAAPDRAEVAPPKKTPPLPQPEGGRGQTTAAAGADGRGRCSGQEERAQAGEAPKVPAGPVEPRVPARLKVRYRQESFPGCASSSGTAT